MTRHIVVKGNYGSYEFTQDVFLSDDDERDPIDVAWYQLRHKGHLSLGMASKQASIVSDEYINEY